MTVAIKISSLRLESGTAIIVEKVSAKVANAPTQLPISKSTQRQ